ncbi:MAG: hypothetical protein WCD11_15560 [Solirubrobacteraceae bacterium]
MGKFENHLWTEFVREHGDAMARASRPAVTHAHRRSRLVAGTGLGLVGASAAVALVLAATSTSPAFAVTRNRDGTVTISIERASGIAGANAKLHQLGIRARVVSRAPSDCQPTLSLPTDGQGIPAPSHEMRETANAYWTINPRQIRTDSTLALTPPPAPPGQNSSTGSSSGQVWSCGTEGPGAGNSGPPPAPPTGNSGNSGASSSSGASSIG